MTYVPGDKVRVVNGSHRGRLGVIVDHEAMLAGIGRLLVPSPSERRLRERYIVQDGQCCVQLAYDFVTGAPQDTVVIDTSNLRSATRFQSGQM